MPALVELTGVDLGGLVLTPGVYNFATSAQLTGNLTLDAQGNPNALFVFKMGSTLTTASGSSVTLVNGASSCNLYWQVGSSATLGTTTSFAGNIMALASITLNTGASLSGRALARTGAVTLANNLVSPCVSAPVVCPTITLSPATLPGGSAGTPYSQTIVASGGLAPYTYSVSGGTLPAGLSLNPVTGAITGTPAGNGSFSFTITATDGNGCVGSRLYTLQLNAGVCPSITLNPVTLPNGVPGITYSQAVVASGGVAPYSYAITGGTLPGGLVLNPATGAISGTPGGVGSFSFTITATDANGCLASRVYTIVLAAIVCPAISMFPSALAPMTVGVAYAQVVSAAGGAAPYVFTVVSGALPPGLLLDPATGSIAGLPTTAGNYAFMIGVTDANGCPAAISYLLASNVITDVSAIPTLSEWGLLLLVFGMMSAAAWGFRRR